MSDGRAVTNSSVNSGAAVAEEVAAAIPAVAPSSWLPACNLA
jgi:hypothetical protein